MKELLWKNFTIYQQEYFLLKRIEKNVEQTKKILYNVITILKRKSLKNNVDYFPNYFMLRKECEKWKKVLVKAINKQE